MRIGADPMSLHLTDPWPCRKCDRNPEIKRDELIAAARVMAANGVNRLDVSIIELLSTKRG